MNHAITVNLVRSVNHTKLVTQVSRVNQNRVYNPFKTSEPKSIIYATLVKWTKVKYVNPLSTSEPKFIT